MGSRLELHEKLCDILGSRNVYFQPPSNVTMMYPAIIYSVDEIDNTFANNQVYGQRKRYSITVIDKNPESVVVDNISKMTTCKHNRNYVNENLNHNVFTIHF